MKKHKACMAFMKIKSPTPKKKVGLMQNQD